MSIRFLWNYSLNQELTFSNVGSNEYAYLAFERSIKEENRRVLNRAVIPNDIALAGENRDLFLRYGFCVTHEMTNR